MRNLPLFSPFVVVFLLEEEEGGAGQSCLHDIDILSAKIPFPAEPEAKADRIKENTNDALKDDR